MAAAQFSASYSVLQMLVLVLGPGLLLLGRAAAAVVAAGVYRHTLCNTLLPPLETVEGTRVQDQGPLILDPSPFYCLRGKGCKVNRESDERAA